MHGTQNGLYDPAKCFVYPIWKSRAFVSRVAEDDLQAPELFCQYFLHPLGAMLILHTRAMNNDGLYQTQGIDCQVPFSSRNLLSGVIASFFSSFSRTNRLAVDDRCRRSRFLASRFSHFLTQPIVNPLPGAVISPFPKDTVNRVPIGETLRKHSPLATRPYNIKNCIDNPPPIDRTAASFGPWRKQPNDQLPLSIRQITGILRPAFHGYGSIR